MPEGENDDMEFLRSLDERLHYVSHGWDQFHHDEKLSYDELDRVLGLMNRADYAITPVNTNMTLSAGFAVVSIKNKGCVRDLERVLTFTSRQLPEGVKWERLAECYMKDRNVELLAMAGSGRPSPKESKYDY